MTTTCLNIFEKLNESIDDTNYDLIDNMTSQNMRYVWVCIKPEVTYDFFYQIMKEKWNYIINNLISNPNKCSNRVSQILELYQYATPENVMRIRKLLDALTTESTRSKVDLDNLVLDVAAEYVLKSKTETFNLDLNLSESMKDLGKVLINNCQCELADIFKVFVNKYRKKYGIKFEGKSKDEVIDLLREDYLKFKEYIQVFYSNEQKIYSDFTSNFTKNNFLNGISNQLTGLYSFSVEGELDRLIPAELGSLKQFFTKVISTYYDNLHPIIWAQIFKSATKKVFVDLPFTRQEIFSFASKQILLNSGPFILKILQTIRPVLSPELASKYNLTKLTYPLLKPREISLMLSKVVYDWDMYIVLENFSASVGHVSKVKKVNYPLNIFIIKMIKPLAVAQSCWEYKTLYDIFIEGSCEANFIQNLLNSNGRELNVENEIKNLNDGHKYYTDNYRNVYSVDLNAKLTTIENIPGIIVPNCWYALSMTLAPGIPLSKLVENDLVKTDTKYRAKLHRCLDILVYKFFLNIIQNGFYHGDLHAGNIFFSYDENQMTLIDFGAVGHLDIYANDSDTKVLLDIIIKSIFYNYDEMFDELSKLLNTKCTETQIDMTSSKYQKLKQELYQHRIRNLQNAQAENKKAEIYKNDIFSKERIDQEKSGETVPSKEYFDPAHVESIYSYLKIHPVKSETIVENRDVLPEFTEIVGKSENISFAGVLEKMIKFYASSGINIAIKFSEFYEFQKAYALLLGVLHKVNYNSYRSGIAIGKAFKNWKNISALLHVQTTAYVVQQYFKEKAKSKNIGKQIESNLSSNPNANITDLSSKISSVNDETDEYYSNKAIKYRIKYMNLASENYQ